MEISFKTKKLKELCEQRKAAEKKLGTRRAKRLRTRMADLQAVSVVAELCVGRPHPLEGNRVGQFALDLIHPQRLVFMSGNDPTPKKGDGSIDWNQITRVRIIEIGDYHG